MEAIEIIILSIGIILVAATYILSEKFELGGRDIDEEISSSTKKIAEELAREEVERELANTIDEKVEAAAVELDKIANEKILAVGNYSDDVLKKIEDNHSEVMFLYNMLNEKETVLKDTIRDIEALKVSVKKMAAANDVSVSVLKKLEEAAAKKRAKQTGGRNGQGAGTASYTSAGAAMYTSAERSAAVGTAETAGIGAAEAGIGDENVAKAVTGMEMSDGTGAVTGIGAENVTDTGLTEETEAAYGTENTAGAAGKYEADINGKEKNKAGKDGAEAYLSDNNYSRTYPLEAYGQAADFQNRVELKTENIRRNRKASAETGNKNEEILRLHREGKTNMEIAKKLGIGIGEVRLVIDLFKD